MIDDKIVSVILSCLTDAHFKGATRYIELALKSNFLGEKRFYMALGMIATMRGVRKDVK